MVTLTERREAIADALKGVFDPSELSVYARWPDQVVFPALIVWPTSSTAVETFDGERSLNFDLVLLAAQAGIDNERGQEKLDAFLSGEGPDLIEAAIDAAPALNLALNGWSDYGILDLGTDESPFWAWGCRFSAVGL